MSNHPNKLLYGDNLTLMKEMPACSVDLIYLDPPFNSKKTYNLMYKNMVGEPVDEQVEAFCDSWTMDAEKQELMNSMHETMRKYDVDANFIRFLDLWMQALGETQPALLAYLLYMTVRLLEMRRLLKSTGSIYYHCDSTASHYIKIIMDVIFGHKNFRNEVVWYYPGKFLSRIKDFPRTHDTILKYSKTGKYLHFQVEGDKDERRKKTLDRGYTTRLYKNKDGSFKGRELVVYKGSENKENIKKLINSDNYTKISYVEPSGNPLTDVFILNILHPKSKERLGYETQKPVALLDRIIKASCPEDGIVLDPFCGCGTTIYAAHENNRKWIGMDIAILSTLLVKRTLKLWYNLKEEKDYTIDGIPVSEEGARHLWDKDKFQFQNWAVERVRGFCTKKKTRDSGIDGALYFREETTEKKELKRMIISVKGGKLKAHDVRDLIGTVEKEKATMGGLISFDAPSKDMLQAASKLGRYKDTLGNQYDRIQFLTISAILKDKKEFSIPYQVNRKDFEKYEQTVMY